MYTHALFLWMACAPENGLASKDGADDRFDTGTGFTVGDDSGVDSADSAEVVDTDGTCDAATLPVASVAQDDACLALVPTPSWTLEALWVDVHPPGAASAVVGQLTDDDGDGGVTAADAPDLLTSGDGASVRLLDGRDGTERWSTTLTSITDQLAIGDVDADGWPDAVAVTNFQVVALEGRTGDTMWLADAPPGHHKGTCGAVGLADLDADGTPEVYYGNMILDGATGATRGVGEHGAGVGVGNDAGQSVATDLDGDGRLEVVVGNAAYDADGNTVWSNDAADGVVAIGDLDVDGRPEIVSVNSEGATLMDAEGGILWTFPFDRQQPSLPIVADLDGDGAPEVILPTVPDLIALDASGTERWRVTDVPWALGRGGASAADLDGDGAWEVIWAGPTMTQVLSGADGSVRATYPGEGNACASSLPVVDLDGDDHAELVVYSALGELRVLHDASGFADAGPQWNQMDFHITNIDDDGHVPARTAPNWQGENNFRAAPAQPLVVSLFPVIRDVCVEECGSTASMSVWVSVANDGAFSWQGSVSLELWGTSGASATLLGETTVSGPIEAGTMSAADAWVITNVPLPLDTLELRFADTDPSGLDTCGEAVESVTWAEPICP